MGSMRRAGRKLAKDAWDERRKFVRRNLPMFGVWTLIYSAATAILLILGSWHREFFAGMAIVGYPCSLWALLQMSAAKRLFDGAVAEEWTAAMISKGWK